jgi:hypothetical protein
MDIYEREKRLHEIKTNFDKPEPYPDGYEEVQEIVNNAQERVRQLDEEIRNPPKDKGPQPNLHPPGAVPNAKSQISEDERKTAIEKQKVQIKEEAWKNIENATKDGDKESDKKARDISREKLFPNEYKKLDGKEIEDAFPKERDMEASQNFADAQLKDKGDSKASKVDTVPSTQNVNMGGENKPSSMSMRFSQSLGYSKINDDIGSRKGKSAEKEATESKTPTMSMSARFTQSASYMSVGQEPERSKDKPAKEIDKDRDD